VIGRNGETNLVAEFQILPFGVVGAVHFEWITRHRVLPFASAQSRTLVNVFGATPMLMMMIASARWSMLMITSSIAFILNDINLGWWF
jgi:hypothetical protein